MGEAHNKKNDELHLDVSPGGDVDAAVSDVAANTVLPFEVGCSATSGVTCT